MKNIQPRSLCLLQTLTKQTVQEKNEFILANVLTLPIHKTMKSKNPDDYSSQSLRSAHCISDGHYD